jgi:cytochrome c oxidase cbb3-type subunit 4
MEFEDIRGVLTPLLGIVLFLAIVRWAFGKESKKVYDEAANLPFMDDDDSAPDENGAANQRKTI